MPSRVAGGRWRRCRCPASALTAEAFQAACVDAFVASWSAWGFSSTTIENNAGVLERFLDLLAVRRGRRAPTTSTGWSRELVARRLAASTRRGYVQAFKDFHRFLVARKAAEIEATFGVVMVDPVDEFNAARHVGNDSPSTAAAADAGADGGVLRVLAGADRHGPQVRSRRPGLRVVPDAVSLRAAFG